LALAAYLATFLGQDTVGGIRLLQYLDDARLGGAVDFTDKVVAAFLLHLDVLNILGGTADELAGLAGGAQGDIDLRGEHRRRASFKERGSAQSSRMRAARAGAFALPGTGASRAKLRPSSGTLPGKHNARPNPYRHGGNHPSRQHRRRRQGDEHHGAVRPAPDQAVA